MVVRISTMMHVEKTAKFGKARASQRISTIMKHESDTMKQTQIISVKDLQTK